MIKYKKYLNICTSCEEGVRIKKDRAKGYYYVYGDL